MGYDIPFRKHMRFEYGVLETVSPLVRRLVARNPNHFTYYGTVTHVIGHGKVAIIDAGPDQPEHVRALLDALEGEDITHQLVTHTHLDHSPATRELREATGAKTYGFGPHGQGRHERGATVEMGADLDFVPDVVVAHGELIEGDGWTIECVHTPGHCSNHLCFELKQERALFTGDHVMGWSTSVISPPDGDMRAYMASLRLLLERDDKMYFPTHGPPVEDPKPFVEAFIRHRENREAEILDCIEQGLDRIAQMVPVMYADVPNILHPAAARSVFAHVIDMVERGLLACESMPSLDVSYAIGARKR